MTDPIVQDQNQNGQNPQTSQTTTPEIDFKLNLPTNEETLSPEEPVVSLDFSDLGTTETTPVETQQPIIEQTSGIAEVNQPKVEDLQQNIINSIDNISLGQTSETVETQPETNESQIENKGVIASDSVAIQPETLQPTHEVIEATPETTEIKTEPVATQPEVIEVQPETTESQSKITEIKQEKVKTEPETINPIDEIATQLPPAPVEEVLQQPETKDNRLEQEDALVAENKGANEPAPIIENKEVPEVKEEVLNVFDESSKQPELTNENIDSTPEITQPISEPEQEIMQQEAPTIQPEQNIPSTNLQQDHAIIQQLQASAGIQSVPVATQPIAPAPTEVNLDDLLNSPAPQQQPNPSNLSNPSIIPAFTGIQGFSLPPIAAQLAQQAKQPLNKKILINFGIGVIALVVGGFMFKTMYPLEYQKLFGGSSNTTIENSLATTSGAIDETTGIDNTATDDGLFENPALANYHAAADNSGTNDSGSTNSGFNAFEDIETTMAEDPTATKEKLQNYIDQGKKYLVMGKKTNDKEATKYGLFLYKKASALLLDIENGSGISTDDLNAQMADFETYLQKLTGTGSHDEIILQQPTTPTPEEFFGSENNGNTQEPETTTPTEIPSTTESGTMTEKTQTPNENLSGNENSDTQSNELNG